MSRAKTQTESVYGRLTAKLDRGELPPGERISEAKVAAMFGVGRGPARESMLRMISEGRLAKKGAYGRTYVRYIDELNREDVARRYELREVIEGLAARLAADNMTGREIRELRRLDRLVLDAVLNGDREARLNACLEFHRYLLSQCGNNLLLAVAEGYSVLPMLARSLELDEKLIRRIMPRGRRSTWLTVAVQAIAAHNPAEAELRMRSWLRTLTAAVREGAESR
ncbi:MAG: GntR family transcriptional regulator [Planctomycetota bacterium]|nr:GntR family transcriptional regulator [Planctomycetota bacterium]